MNTSEQNQPPKILDGKIARATLGKALSERVHTLGGVPIPTLAIIQVGNRADSSSYISAKTKFAVEIGAKVQLISFPEAVSSDETINEIKRLNGESSIHGIIVQLPLPAHFDETDRARVVQSVSKEKDVDGLVTGTGFVPATARGIGELLKFYGVELTGKKVAVVGRSALVGKPTAELCRKAGAEVVVGHSKTEDLVVLTKSADIIISAVGKPGLISAGHVRSGQVLVDVGTTPVTNSDISGKNLLGDVDFEAVSAVIGPTGAISPVPGGVGPMTVLALFENLIDAWYNQITNK